LRRLPIKEIGGGISGFIGPYAPRRAVSVSGFAVKKRRRNLLVMSALLGALAVTSVLLVAMAPPPLARDSARVVMAAQSDEGGLDEQAFRTEAEFVASRWVSIRVRHSRSDRGDMASLAQGDGRIGDHFVIGNGQGMADGQLAMSERWLQQLQARLDNGRLPEGCISICLVGDLDSSLPTAAQIQQLTRLVSALQARCRISISDVVLDSKPNSPLAIGRQFPSASFRQQLLR
jgi:hypothetical protein